MQQLLFMFLFALSLVASPYKTIGGDTIPGIYKGNLGNEYLFDTGSSELVSIASDSMSEESKSAIASISKNVDTSSDTLPLQSEMSDEEFELIVKGNKWFHYTLLGGFWFLIATLWTIIVAFKVDILTGILVLFFPPVGIVVLMVKNGKKGIYPVANLVGSFIFSIWAVIKFAESIEGL